MRVLLQDESYRYVLPNHMLFHIAEVIPTSVPALLACCNPVPPLVRINADVLVSVIIAARAEPALSEGLHPSRLSFRHEPHTHTHAHRRADAAMGDYAPTSHGTDAPTDGPLGL
jgi:ribonuclease D